MRSQACLIALAVVGAVSWGSAVAQTAERPTAEAIPDARQLMQDVVAHQKVVDKVRENYTYTSDATVQELDGHGGVTKTESVEAENFFVHGHAIRREIKKNGQALSDHDAKKQAEGVSKLVEKAEKTPTDQPLDGGESISISRILEIMDVGAPRREMFRGRPTIVFDFAGRKDAKTHGMAENASKKLKGRIWIDEADREVAHLEVAFDDNFHVGGGLIANIQKGSSFRFDQAPVDGGLWLPTGAEGNVQARIVLVKSVRQHFVERDFGYKRFSVDAQQIKDAKVVGEKQ